AGFCDYRRVDVMVIAIEMTSYARAQRRIGGTPWARHLDEQEIERLKSGDFVVVSENFATLNRVAAGDTIEFTTPTGPRRARILHTTEDSSWPGGVIFMDLEAYRRLFERSDLSYVNVILEPGVQRADARAALAKALGGRYSIYIYEKSQIQKIAGDTLDQ